MKRALLIIALLIASVFALNAQTVTLEGQVLDESRKPVEASLVFIKETEQWSMANEKGEFKIPGLSVGNHTIEISCLGYVKRTMELSIKANIKPLSIILKADNLTLASASVTAKEDEHSAATTRTLDKTALDHVQMLNVTDISSLLPGGATTNNLLTSEQRFSIRSGATEAGNATFGTAIEVDGVRLSSNASYGGTLETGTVSNGVKGVATNNIASSNVESIEVISGVPSVEYGDVGSGVIKINTRKGKTPFLVTMTTNPNTKQISLGKGFGLGARANGSSIGTLNLNAEYTKSIRDVRSPYESYVRRNVSAIYSTLMDRGFFEGMPLRFDVTASANLGGYDTEADPDKFIGTYEKVRDNSIRGKVSASWLLNKPWITNLSAEASIVYSDKQQESRKYYSSSSSGIAIHGLESGYFAAEDYDPSKEQAVIMIPKGYWYNSMFIDDKPLTYKASIKTNWARKFGSVSNKLKAGVEFGGDGNLGHGVYTADMSNAPSFRTYDYSKQPFMNNLAGFLEENASIPIGSTELNAIAGVRAECTTIKGSDYGTVASLSPRGNIKWFVFKEKGRKKKFVKSLSFRGGAGISVKQPSFAILYPIPTYRDIMVLNTPSVNGVAYQAFYLEPRKTLYNPDLVWQKLFQTEVGVDANLGGVRISLAGYYTSTMDSYYVADDYEGFTYQYTDQTDLEAGCTIPAENRKYSIDRTTGAVTVSDRTGALAPQVFAGNTINVLNPNQRAANSKATITRMGLEWTLDFPMIEPISTDIRLDGNLYSYRNVNKDLVAYSPTAQISNGEYYKYVGWYLGNNQTTNGSERMNLNMNVTFTTHIPSVRMIISTKLETSLLRYSKAISEGDNEFQRTYAVDERFGSLPNANSADYDGKRGYSVTYPKYFSTWDYANNKPGEKQDFFTTFTNAAKNGDTELYGALSSLLYKTSYNYVFVRDYISPYFSANFSVTKEIGDFASISFYANNFFRNMGQIYSTKTKKYSAISAYIPAFYYGLTLRLKF